MSADANVKERARKILLMREPKIKVAMPVTQIPSVGTPTTQVVSTVIRYFAPHSDQSFIVHTVKRKK